MEDSGGEVASGEDDGGKRKRARADEGDGRGQDGAVATKDGEFKETKFKVIREVREDMEMVNRGIKFG